MFVFGVRLRYLLIPLVDFANHDDDVAYAVCPGDGVFTGSDEVNGSDAHFYTVSPTFSHCIHHHRLPTRSPRRVVKNSH